MHIKTGKKKHAVKTNSGSNTAGKDLSGLLRPKTTIHIFIFSYLFPFSCVKTMTHSVFKRLRMLYIFPIIKHR